MGAQTYAANLQRVGLVAGETQVLLSAYLGVGDWAKVRQLALEQNLLGKRSTSTVREILKAVARTYLKGPGWLPDARSAGASSPNPPSRPAPRRGHPRRRRGRGLPPRLHASPRRRPRRAQAALDALRRVADLPSFPFEREARSAFRKLAFDIDPVRFRAPPVFYAERPGAAEVAEKVKLLSQALLARKRVRFTYHGIYRGEATRRDVAPYGLAFTRGHWYLVGHDALRDAIRVFRVARMETPEVNGKSPHTPDYEVPKDFRLGDHVGKEPWELGGNGESRLRAEVLFEFPSSLWAARNGKGRLVEERQDGSAVRAFDDVHHVGPFLRWVLSFAGEAKILSPPELAEELRSLARRVAALHEGEPSETWRPPEVGRG